jgi:hypothetical protein
MTKETKAYINDMKTFTKKITSSSTSVKQSRDMLIKAGICNSKGSLKSPYK